MIRTATGADAPVLRALQSLLPEPAPETLERALEDYGLLLVSTDDTDTPVGYAMTLPGGESAYLAELVVAPDARREGRASALLAATMARLPDRVTTLSLAVSPDNDAARSLYEDAGFHVVDVDPEYYDGDPALLLARTL
ncbi:GNAT family N-acetyltransferase [Natronoarchaeum sp. GCM10025321]|uniref:GNAT family N-acetyltransferase n=1 Tax=Natronoarchaeum sp. GCM10025321 TaxID=3252684 RepID=UPI00360F9B5A